MKIDDNEKFDSDCAANDGSLEDAAQPLNEGDAVTPSTALEEQDDALRYAREKRAFEEAFGELPKEPPETILVDSKKPKEIAEMFLAAEHSFQGIRTLVHYLGSYYQWKENVYRKVEVDVIKSDLMHFLEGALVVTSYVTCSTGLSIPIAYAPLDITPTILNTVEKMLRLLVLHHYNENTPCWIGDCEQPSSVVDTSQLIFGKTKILNLADMQTLPPSPRWLNFAALSYDFDSTEECPKWDAFLDSILGDDEESKVAIMEFIGLCLTTITKFQKALFLKGPIRCGKGTIARITQALVGKHNSTAQSMSDFGQQFGFETFIGKTFVSVGEARSDKKWTSGATEKILNITGEDVVKVDIKHRTAVNVRLQTKLLFMSNSLPTIPDPSGALPSRFIFVKLPKSFFGQEDLELEGKLLAELPGIFNSAIRHLNNLLDRGHFIQPETGKVLAERMKGISSPLNEFVKQLKPYAHPDDIWKEWVLFCKDEEEPFGKKKDLWTAIEKAGYDYDPDAAKIFGKIRDLGGEATARQLRDCARKFKKDPALLDQKLQSMVKLGLLDVRDHTAENNLKVKVYSIKPPGEETTGTGTPEKPDI